MVHMEMSCFSPNKAPLTGQVYLAYVWNAYVVHWMGTTQ